MLNCIQLSLSIFFIFSKLFSSWISFGNWVFVIFLSFCCSKSSEGDSWFNISFSFLLDWSLLSSSFNLSFSFFISFSSLFSRIVSSIVNLIFSCGDTSFIENDFSFPSIFIWLSEIIELFLNWFIFIFFLNIFLVVILISLLGGAWLCPSKFIELFLLIVNISSFSILLIFISSFLFISNKELLSLVFTISIWLTFSGIFFDSFSAFNIVNLLLSCDSSSKIGFVFSIALIVKLSPAPIEMILNLWCILLLYTFFVDIFISLSFSLFRFISSFLQISNNLFFGVLDIMDIFTSFSLILFSEFLSFKLDSFITVNLLLFCSSGFNSINCFRIFFSSNESAIWIWTQ